MSAKLDEFLKALKEYKRDDVAKLLETGIINEVSSENLDDIVVKVVSLRDVKVMDVLAKTLKPLPVTALNLDMKNRNNQDFITTLLTKYTEYFDLKDEAVAGVLFEKACETGSVTAVKTFIKKNIGRTNIGKMGSACDEIFELLRKYGASAFSAEERVSIYTDAAFSREGAERLVKLADWGFDVKEETTDGKSCRNALKAKIDGDKYPNNKSGVAAKQHDKSTLSALDRISKINTKKRITAKQVICVLLALVLLVAAEEGLRYGIKAIIKANTPQKLVVENGDEIVMDFEGYVDGELFDGGTAKKYKLVIGSGSFIDGFEEQLVGASVGDDVDVNVTFPDDYFVDSTDYYNVTVMGGEPILAGKDAVFKVHIIDIIE